MKRLLPLAFALLATPTFAAEAVLAGGCFWSMQTDMEKMPGAGAIVVGYTGGSEPNPTYESHDGGTTPHVEAVKLTYDTATTPYAAVLDYYFRHIDPADGNGQFCDQGPTYCPAIFYATESEKQTAEAKKAGVARLLGRSIEVAILPASTFWPAEDYHQDYAAKNPLHYRAYRTACGRDAKVRAVWGND